MFGARSVHCRCRYDNNSISFYKLHSSLCCHYSVGDFSTWSSTQARLVAHSSPLRNIITFSNSGWQISTSHGDNNLCMTGPPTNPRMREGRIPRTCMLTSTSIPDLAFLSALTTPDHSASGSSHGNLPRRITTQSTRFETT
jgi:hypothetical protein